MHLLQARPRLPRPSRTRQQNLRITTRKQIPRTANRQVLVTLLPLYNSSGSHDSPSSPFT